MKEHNAIRALLEALGEVAEEQQRRRLEGKIKWNHKNYTYTVYRIRPVSGAPLVRVDIKEGL